MRESEKVFLFVGSSANPRKEMSKRKDPLLEALKDGHSYTWTIPDGGNLASMRNAVKHGQTLTMSPVADPNDILVGDMVLVRWHSGTIFHLIGEIQGDQFLIVNSVGKINGWVDRVAILGKVTQIVDPEPRPSLPTMLDRLEVTYHKLIDHQRPDQDDADRLLSIPRDLRWYSVRIGTPRWDEMPRSNKWSFEQNLWHLTKRAESMPASESPPPYNPSLTVAKCVWDWQLSCCPFLNPFKASLLAAPRRNLPLSPNNQLVK